MGRYEYVVQDGQASCRVGVKTSQAQGGGGLAQAKSSSLLSPMALQSGAVMASRRPLVLGSTMSKGCLRARESQDGR